MKLPIMSEARKSNITKWVVISSLSVVVVILIVCLVGCSTVRGVITGVEAVGAGVLMDARGAVDGIDSINDKSCTYDSVNGM